MKQPIKIIRGTTKIININLDTVLGAEYVLQDNEVIRFGVKRKPYDKEFAISKALTNDDYEDGVYKLILNPSDTELLPFGRYYYDIGIQNGASYLNVIECSTFEIKYNITGREVNS